jgi:hypothetical protein
MTVFVSIAGFGAVFMVVFLTVLCRDQRCHSVSGARNLGNAFGVFGLPAGRRSHVVKLVAPHSGNVRTVVVLRPRTAADGVGRGADRTTRTQAGVN